MTDHKRFRRIPEYKSLYTGLFKNILLGILLALIVWGIIMIPATQIINKYFVTEKRQQKRRNEYLESLQSYVTGNYLTMESSNEISEWVRRNPYVYLMVYEGDNDGAPSVGQEIVAPGAKDKLTEYSGARIGDSLDRSSLVASARSGGYVRIYLADGSLIVALSEYTENLYFMAFDLVSIFAAALTFVLVLVRYIRIVIERIKRFESDVTIVSEIDMNYEILSEGGDEISTLSKRVENMRQTMLEHIKSEQEAREANTELITSISHDIRTPLTVIMGYIEMMKEHNDGDEVMANYLAATESTALRLKQQSDDMFKYSLLFGDVEKILEREDYDAITLFDQLLSEHILLMRERGYDIKVFDVGSRVPKGSLVNTDPQKLMRIIDNIFSNMGKYADIESLITISTNVVGRYMTVEFKNKIAKVTGAESNGIGLKTCVRLGSLVAKKFEHESDGEYFISRLVMEIKLPEEGENKNAVL